MQDGGASRARNPDVGVNNEIIRISQSQYQSLYQLNWKLAGMNCLLDMVMFDIWDGPNVAGILARRVAGILPDFCPFEIFLAWVASASGPSA